MNKDMQGPTRSSKVLFQDGTDTWPSSGILFSKECISTEESLGE